MGNSKQPGGISNFEAATYAAGSLSREASLSCVNLFYLAFLNIYMGLDILVLTVAFVIIRALDAFCNPLLASVINNAPQSRRGRYRPWILMGGLLNGASLVFMFLPLGGASVLLRHAYYILLFLFWSLTCTLQEVPYWAMIPAIAQSGPDRDKVSALSRFIGGNGGFIITFLGTSVIIPKVAPAIGIERAHFVLGIIAAGIVILFSFSPFVFNKERYELPVHKIKPREIFSLLRSNDQLGAYTLSYLLFLSAVNTALLQFIYVFIYYGDMGGLGLLSQGLGYMLFLVVSGTGLGLGTMFYPLIVKKIPGHKIYSMGFFFAAIGMLAMFFIFFFLRDHYGAAGSEAAKWINVLLISLPAAFFITPNGLNLVATTVMAAEITDYNEWKTGRRSDSVIFSIQTMIMKLSNAVATLLIGIGIKAANLPAVTQSINASGVFEYSFQGQAGAAVTFAALDILRVFLFLVPVPLCIAGYIVYRRNYWLYGEKYENIKREAEEKRAKNHEGE